MSACLICKGETACHTDGPSHGRTTEMDVPGLKPCWFRDGYGGRWPGYTDGSRWNGWLNVCVDEDTWLQMLAVWDADGDEFAIDTEPEDGGYEASVVHTRYGPLRSLSWWAAMSEDYEED